ncbi:hypothetical protein A3C59_05190 [Candidatus Daviesbacteria bacterium RIFCSPHIGHO2_02_FULL_36_13]|uniref:Uncharacterized protein n=1 Tax=Candidatus Daviesbacteria bacterium RIFCSPHIGHO2_02_FULL_36_13 TaxID=1797768 RepID=A0A1F5JUY6_9BACT|nr:MAG: hypothetical protein A3C59_05190 [Candidatus Daviesbacteria bacterium RIFCSPHIGHO2_02_FULL_36_13]
MIERGRQVVQHNRIVRGAAILIGSTGAAIVTACAPDYSKEFRAIADAQNRNSEAIGALATKIAEPTAEPTAASRATATATGTRTPDATARATATGTRTATLTMTPTPERATATIGASDIDARILRAVDEAIKKMEASKAKVLGPEGPFADLADGVQGMNVPDKVDSNVVDTAKGIFKNTTGVGKHVFADPGGLLVGPDFGSTSAQNPFGRNPEGWDAMYGSGGSIRPFSPVSQEVIRWAGEAHQNLPEGGFVFFSAGEMTVSIPKDKDSAVAFKMPYQEGHNYFFVARGLYPDGKQNTDRNRTVSITDYKPGHVELSMYESRLETNLGFISEGQFLQKVATSHVTDTNCGAEGCSDLTAILYDANTDALEIWKHSQDRPSANLDDAIKRAKSGWTLSYSNWQTR